MTRVCVHFHCKNNILFIIAEFEFLVSTKKLRKKFFFFYKYLLPYDCVYDWRVSFHIVHSYIKRPSHLLQCSRDYILPYYVRRKNVTRNLNVTETNFPNNVHIILSCYIDNAFLLVL